MWVPETNPKLSTNKKTTDWAPLERLLEHYNTKTIVEYGYDN